MDTDLLQLTGLEARIAGMVGPTLLDMGYELVRVSVLGRDTPTVQIMADRADGSLIGVADCEAISHAVGAVLDVDDPIPGAWNLEVSSAGIDRPLTREKDWNRFSGHLARAEVNIPVDGRKRFAGTVMGAADGYGRMRVEDGSEVALPLAEIRKARLVLTDALIEASAQMAGVVHGADGDEAGDEGSGGEEAADDASGAGKPDAPRTPKVPKLHPGKPIMRQADGRQTGARIGGAKVGGGKTAKAPANKGGGAKPHGQPGRKPH